MDRVSHTAHPAAIAACLPVFLDCSTAAEGCSEAAACTGMRSSGAERRVVLCWNAIFLAAEARAATVLSLQQLFSQPTRNCNSDMDYFSTTKDWRIQEEVLFTAYEAFLGCLLSSRELRLKCSDLRYRQWISS
jgi:hypothetical protein